MRSAIALALSALAINTVAAAPLEARDFTKDGVAWHVVTKHVIETVDVYKTVYADAAPAVQTKSAGAVQHQHHIHQHFHSKKPSSTAVAAPAPAPETPTPAPAPAPSPSPAPVVNSVPAPSPSPKTTPAPSPSPKPASLPAVQAAPVKEHTPAPQQAKPQPAPAPSPSPSPSPAPSPSPSPAAAPSPAPAPQKAPTSPSTSTSTNSNSGSVSGASLFQGYSKTLPGASVPFACAGGCSGDMTFFNPSQGVGACGYKDGKSAIWTDDDDVVAVAVKMMGTLSSGDTMNPFCNKKIKITNPATGKSAVGTVTDKCFGCPGEEDIDLSPHLFKQVGIEGTGRYHDVQWSWIG